MRDAMRLPPESSTTGGGDVLDTLERDHRQVEQLFARASLNAGESRLMLIPEIVKALTVHAEVEEQVVYPAIEKTVGGGDVLGERARDEHQEMKGLLARLGAASADDDALIEDLRMLQLVVQAHVAVEEGELFPAYRAVATADDLAALTESADAARSSAAEKVPA
jgi:hemerythrin superfamily protein